MSTLAFSAGPLLTIWAGADYGTASVVPLGVLAAGCFIDGLSFVPRMLLQAAGRPDLIARYLMITSVPYLVGAVALVQIWGIVGAAVAWTARTSVECMLMLLAARRTAGVSLDVATFLPPVFVGSLLALAVPAALVPWTRDSIASSAVVACASVLAYTALTWARVLTAEERNWAVAYCGALLRRTDR